MIFAKEAWTNDKEKKFAVNGAAVLVSANAGLHFPEGKPNAIND
jgi:hypothetical protein